MTTNAITINDAAGAAEFEHPDPVELHALGFWLYILSDLVLFAALFATYAVLMRNYAGGPTGRDLFDLKYAFGETMVLLCSSATYGMAMLAVHKGKKYLVLVWLGVTFLFGLGFIAMEFLEFFVMIAEGSRPERSAFLSAFFTLVGTHGTHVIFGLIWMAFMSVQVMLKGLTTSVQSKLMRLSMFWHFLDIVWIGIFTIVYLLGVM